MKKKILITGAAGFIGHKLNSFLKGKYEVLGLDFNIINNLQNELQDIDILDEKKFSNFFQKNKPDFVFHLAGYSGPKRNDESPKLAYRYNVDIMKILIKNLTKKIPIFFPSTDSVYSGQDKPNELINLDKPKSYHGQLKLECEKILTNYTEKFFIFRQSNVHGEGNYKPNSKMAGTGCFIDFAIDELSEGKKIDAFSNVKRCFLNVDELVKIYSSLIESKLYGIFNIGSKTTSYFDRIKKICDKKNIITKNLLNPTLGKIKPLIQDLDTEKFKSVFKIQMN